MSIFNLAKKLVPAALKREIRARIVEIAREEAAPRMIYGYLDSTGAWRPQTRMSNTVFFNNRESVKIGNNVFVGHYVVLDGTKELEIGEGTQVGSWVGIFTHSSHNAIRIYGYHYPEVPEAEKRCYETGPVKIGRYVFIGSQSLILAGVEIGDGAIISSTSVVSKNVAPFSLVTREGKEIKDGARKLDILNLSKAQDPQLEEWYREWQTV